MIDSPCRFVLGFSLILAIGAQNAFVGRVCGGNMCLRSA